LASGDLGYTDDNPYVVGGYSGGATTTSGGTAKRQTKAQNVANGLFKMNPYFNLKFNYDGRN